MPKMMLNVKLVSGALRISTKLVHTVEYEFLLIKSFINKKSISFDDMDFLF